jgi:hypothetical protein
MLLERKRYRAVNVFFVSRWTPRSDRQNREYLSVMRHDYCTFARALCGDRSEALATATEAL